MQCPTDGWGGLLISFAFVVLWYMFSIGLTFYNKWLFRTYDLHFPLTVTTCHMVTNFLFAWLCRVILFRVTGRRRPVLSRWHYVKSAFPTGFAGALDIGLSNASLMYIGIALYTMCKSTSIVFLLVFAFCFGIEKPRWSLTAVILSIGVGIALFTYGGDTGFHLLGFLMVLTATVMAGLRWVLTQILLQKKSLGLHNPVDTLYHVTPVMAFVLMPLALGLEGPTFFSSTHMFLGSDASVFITMGVITAGAVLAFLMNFSEFMLISRTSSVTMSVAGIFKEVCTIALSVLLLGEKMSALNVVGMVVTIGGIVLYNVIKFRQNFGEGAEKDNEEQDYAKLRGEEEEEDDEDEDEHLRKWAVAEEGESDTMRGESSGRDYQARAYGSEGSEEGESYEMRPAVAASAAQSTREHTGTAHARTHGETRDADRCDRRHRGESEEHNADLLLESTASVPLSRQSTAAGQARTLATTAAENSTNGSARRAGVENDEAVYGFDTQLGSTAAAPLSREHATAERASTPTTIVPTIEPVSNASSPYTGGVDSQPALRQPTEERPYTPTATSSVDNTNNNNSNSAAAAGYGGDSTGERDNGGISTEEEDQFAKLLASTRPLSRQATNERERTPTPPRQGTGERGPMHPSPLGGDSGGTTGSRNTGGSGGDAADFDALLGSTMPLSMSRQSTAELHAYAPTDQNTNNGHSEASSSTNTNNKGDASGSGRHAYDDFAWSMSHEDGEAPRALAPDSAGGGRGVESSNVPSTAQTAREEQTPIESAAPTVSATSDDHHGHVVPHEIETFWNKSAYSPGPTSAAEGTAATAFFSSAGLLAHDTYEDDDVYVEQQPAAVATDTHSDVYVEQRPAWARQTVALVPDGEDELQDEDEDEETLFSGGVSRQQSGGTGEAATARGEDVMAVAGDGWDDFDGEDVEF